MASFIWNPGQGGGGGGGTVTAVTASGPIIITGNPTTNPNITITQADATHDGYLSAVDWNTFNNKQPAGSYVLTSRQINTTAPLTGGGDLSADRTLAMPVATTVVDGYLSAANFVTFNNKQPAGSYITALTGDVTAAGPGSSAATVAKLQGYTIDLSVPPTNNQVLKYSTGTNTWTAQTDIVGTGTVTNVSANAPLSVTSPTTTPDISISLATTSTDGYLSSTDWNTFNGKQAAGSYLTALTGDATASGPGSAALTLATVNGNVGTFGTATQVSTVTVNAKGLVTAASNTSIQIAESQVTNLVSDLAGKQATGNYITALTGDATATGPGSVAITLATVNGNVGTFGSSTSIPTFTVNAKGLVTAASGNVVVAPAGTLSGTTLNATVVSSSLTSVGTITSGTWNGTTIAIANGGTGQTTQTAAFNALSPITAKGDLISSDGTDNVALPVGTDGLFLSADSTEATGLKWVASPNAPTQFNLTVTGTNWTTNRAVGMPYQASGGEWRFRFNIVGTVTGGPTTLSLTISDVVFKNVSMYFQACTAYTTGTSAPTNVAITVPNTGTVAMDFGATAISDATVSGDVELDAAPTL